MADIRARFPKVNVHGFRPTEIDHIAQVSGLSIDELRENKLEIRPVIDRLEALVLARKNKPAA